MENSPIGNAQNRMSSVEFVRAHRSQFLGPRDPDLRDLAAFLVTDALVLGAEDIFVKHWQRWFILGSPFDWIADESKLDDVEAFHRIQIFHKHHKNSNRANILLTAFATDVVTVSPAGVIYRIKGDSDCDVVLSELDLHIKGMRVVMFQGLSS
jgi:hypothetical protein